MKDHKGNEITFWGGQPEQNNIDKRKVDKRKEIVNGMRLTYLFDKCSLEMSDGKIGLTKELTVDEVTALIGELLTIRQNMDRHLAQQLDK